MSDELHQHLALFNEDGNMYYSAIAITEDSWFSNPELWSCQDRDAAIQQLEDRIYERFTELDKDALEMEEPEYRPVLHVGVQRFTFTYSAENKDHGNWYRKMMAMALARLVLECRKLD